MRILAEARWQSTPENDKPDVSFVPAMERRRLTQLEKAALSVAWQCVEKYKASCVADTAEIDLQIPVVFASRWGEIGTTLKLMRQLHEEGEMSPAGFSNSVHNAAPGHWSLFTKNKAPYTAIAAGEKSREMGMLEASTYDGRVLFVYAEETTPEFYADQFEHCLKAHAEAMLIDND